MLQPTGERSEAVLLNTAGGLACGDRLDQLLRWGPGAALTVATQAAEKIYRALDQGATVATRLEIADGASAEWLPQETILFDGARLDRDLRVDMAENAEFLGVEAVILGRAAMDETMSGGLLRDRWRIVRNGRLVYADALHIDGGIAARMRKRALGAGAAAFATILHVAPDAGARLDRCREALEPARGRAAASAWNGMLVVRLLAPDGATLRHDLAPALAALRDDRPPPRVWSC